MRRPKRSRIDYTGFAHGKGPTRDAVKTARQATERAWIARVRWQVFTRDPVCRCCHGATRCFLPDQMHEIVPRSATRGWPMEERFNTRNCIRLCAWCHERVTRHKVDVVPVSTAGADGEVSFVEHRGTR